MTMNVTRTDIPDVLVIEPKVFGDDRGFFYESFNGPEFEALTGVKTNFVQDNHSRSARNVLRGLHYQVRHPQGKLVRVVMGEVFLYKTTDTWYPEHERSLLWRDSTLHIDWPLQGEPLLAAKDAGGKALREAEVFA
ncbi:dTDP-4-dehydrorhamnose 3,5-epimerase family protein [Cupriavidus sp. KB_39]|uniref:dTDP-4-dehydrorhamnose 3,5-epimerase family protein n=1 Tax=Cupriavidus sp. KB_39 TaxID=3233036 RepID=UPI003F90694F